MTTSCTHMVRGRAWSMNLGNPVDNAPYRLDRVALDHDLSRRRPPLPPPRLPTHVRRQAQPLPPGCGHMHPGCPPMSLLEILMFCRA